jgi:hypothetical protein
MIRLLTLLALLLVCGATRLTAQDPLRERFAARLDSLPQDIEGEATPEQMAPVWNVMDSIALRELNAGHTPDEVNAFFPGLPGYGAPTPGKSVVIGAGRFYSQLPRETPSYFVAPVRVHGEPMLLGIYQFGINQPGRISVYRQEAGTWTATARLDTRWPAQALLLPLADSGMAVLTLETFTGADHQNGVVRVWSLENGGLVPRDSIPGEMKEPEVRMATADSVVISFTRYPEYLVAPILGTRLEYDLVLAPEGDHVRHALNDRNPWVGVLDRYYGLLATHRQREAAALLAIPTLAPGLGGKAVSIDDGGDFDAGRGYVIVDAGHGTVRVDVARGADDTWRITKVAPTPDPRGH